MDRQGKSRRIAALLALTTAGSLAAPAAAGATSVFDGGQGITGDPGQANHMTVTYEPGKVTIVDDAKVASTETNCSRPVATDLTTLVCTLDPARGTFLNIDLGDLNDTLKIVEANGGKLDTAYIYDGPGNDKVTATGGAVKRINGPGNDVLRGTKRGENDVQLPGGGNDQIFGGPKRDVLAGGPGNDIIRGGGGNDRIFGNQGNDTLYGEGGNDKLFGGPGNDRAFGGAGSDSYQAQGGNDRFVQ